ncbi:hypothetical protein E2C01_039871 [Portunus trituberculatus]|uniref:Uncharacterized protein n=1 Tax=Portunus trituberculatus TaxID=210409 RepID=A0A5B7FI46_PORTR|nr:hypothetical protein [Portunus trituberculatus]
MNDAAEIAEESGVLMMCLHQHPTQGRTCRSEGEGEGRSGKKRRRGNRQEVLLQQEWTKSAGIMVSWLVGPAPITRPEEMSTSVQTANKEHFQKHRPPFSGTQFLSLQSE